MIWLLVITAIGIAVISSQLSSHHKKMQELAEVQAGLKTVDEYKGAHKQALREDYIKSKTTAGEWIAIVAVFVGIITLVLFAGYIASFLSIK